MTYITPAPAIGKTPRCPKRSSRPPPPIRFSRPGLPPTAFHRSSRIAPEHFREAYARALAEHEAEVAAIAAETAPPSFDNTIAALELSGRALERVGNAFWLLAGANTNDALLEIERETFSADRAALEQDPYQCGVVPPHRHRDARGADGSGSTPNKSGSTERYHTSFRRAGAALGRRAKKRLGQIIERLAELGTAFSQNVLADEQAFIAAARRTKPSWPACPNSCARRCAPKRATAASTATP